MLPNKKVENIINDVSNVLKTKEYHYYFKLDLKNFYGKINHDILSKKIKKQIRSQNVNNLINNAIKTNTVNSELPSKYRESSINSVGVPQGLSISNILANVYMMEFDSEHAGRPDYAYFRYVDDIIVFCKRDEFNNIADCMESKLTDKIEYDLEINEQKKISGDLDKPIDFLGYSILPTGDITIREKNIYRMERSIESIFNDYKNSKDKRIRGNIALLRWKVDLHITGCIKGEKQYGWVKFFKLCQQHKCFYRLDYVVVQVIKRYGLESKLLKGDKYIGKKFSKTFYEITKNPSTKYIPNFNEYGLDRKRNILTSICKRNVETWTDSVINFEFDRFIFRSISSLDQDLQQIYT
jgi:hypothetical protein